MRRLAPVVLLGAAASLTLTRSAMAQQPQPPNRYYGTATFNGLPAATGVPVNATIGGRLCGTTTVREGGRYVLDVLDETARPGCGTAGAAISFTVGNLRAGPDGTYRRGAFVQLNLVAPGGTRYVEAALDLGDVRPCIPVPGEQRCDDERARRWEGDSDAWARAGVTDPDERFNATIVFRVRAGDPATIGAIARILEAPYLKITRVRFSEGESVEIANLGGGAQSLDGWSLRSPARDVVFRFSAGRTLAPGERCRVYAITDARLLLPIDSCGGQSGLAAGINTADAWPDDAGRVVLYYDALDLPGDDTLYSADPANQPPPPNLQGVR